MYNNGTPHEYDKNNVYMTLSSPAFNISKHNAIDRCDSSSQSTVLQSIHIPLSSGLTDCGYTLVHLLC